MAKRGVRNNTLTVALVHVPLGLVQAKSSDADGTKTVLCAPDGRAVKQAYMTDDGEVFARGGLYRGVKGDDGATITPLPKTALEVIEGKGKVESMEIQEFVDRSVIPYERVVDQHYVQPQNGQPSKPLGLIYAALRATGKAAVVKMSVGKRQRLAVVYVAAGGEMVALTLAFAATIKEPDEDVRTVEDLADVVSEKEIGMAIGLIETLSGEGATFDTATDDMIPERERLIARVLAGEDFEEADAPTPEATTDLEDALAASMAAMAGSKS